MLLGICCITNVLQQGGQWAEWWEFGLRSSLGRDLLGRWEGCAGTGILRPMAKYFYMSLHNGAPFIPNSLEKVKKELSLACTGILPSKQAYLLSESQRICSSRLGHKVAQCSYI